MNIFLKARIKTMLFELVLMVFTIFYCLFVKKIQMLASVKSLNIYESNVLQGAYSSFSISACDSKGCSESHLWSLLRHLQQSLELRNFFSRNKCKLYIYFSIFLLNKAGKKIKNYLCRYRKCWFKRILSWDEPGFDIIG